MTRGLIRQHCQGPLHRSLESRHSSPKRPKPKGRRPTIPQSGAATLHLPHPAFTPHFLDALQGSFIRFLITFSHNSGSSSGLELKTRHPLVFFTNRRNPAIF